MTPHTPGPWKIERNGGHKAPSIVGSEAIHTSGRRVGQFSSQSWSQEVCEIHADLDLPGPQANARLIATAPDLLAALKEIEDRVHGYSAGSAIVDMDPEATIDSIHKIARAAIALAEPPTAGEGKR